MQSDKVVTFEKETPLLYKEGVMSQMMDSFTTGPLLIGIPLLLGVAPWMVGLLGAMPFLANIMQIPAIFLVEKYQNRQKIVLLSCFVGRLTLLGVAALYFVPQKEWILPLFLTLCVIRFLAGSIAACAWNSWMNDYIPKDRLGRFFGKRMVLTTSIGAASMIGVSMLLEHFGTASGITPYCTLFLIGFLCSLVSLQLLSNLHHPSVNHTSVNQFTQHFKLNDLRIPFRDANFRHLMIFMGIWSFAVNLAAPFFTIFMMQSLHYSMGTVIRLTLLTQIVYVASLHIWGRYSDLFSNKSILQICGPLFACCFFAWTFVTFPASSPNEFSFLLVVVLHVIMGISTSGINLASNNIALKLCPDQHATSFLATNSLFSSACAGIAPLMGGLLIGLVDKSVLTFNIEWTSPHSLFTLPTLSLNSWDFFFFTAFFLSFIALGYLLKVQEAGEIHRRIVLRTLVFDTARFISNVSTVAGLRAQAAMPQPDSASEVR